jgi:hypothetical protein
VWKGQHCGRDVAVKVIRTYSNDDLQRVIGVGRQSRFLSAFLRANKTTVAILQGGCDLEDAPTSEHPVTNRGDDVRHSVCDGIRLDGQRKHYRLCEGAPGCKSVGTGRLLTRCSYRLHSKPIDDRMTPLAGRRCLGADLHP